MQIKCVNEECSFIGEEGEYSELACPTCGGTVFYLGELTFKINALVFTGNTLSASSAGTTIWYSGTATNAS